MTEAASQHPVQDRGRLFWPALVLGWVVMGIGVRGALADSAATRPLSLATWVVGAALGHDFVWAVGGVVVAWVTGRVVPASIRLPVRVGLAASAVVLLFTWPLVRGYGVRPSTPSALPLDYVPNLVWTLVAVWALVAAAVVATHLRSAPRRHPTPTPAEAGS